MKIGLHAFGYANFIFVPVERSGSFGPGCHALTAMHPSFNFKVCESDANATVMSMSPRLNS
jgi:hypothetical protein